MDKLPTELTTRQVQFLTLPEAADFLRVSHRTLYRWVREGKLKCFRVGNTTRIPRAAIEEFTASHTGVQTHAAHAA